MNIEIFIYIFFQMTAILVCSHGFRIIVGDDKDNMKGIAAKMVAPNRERSSIPTHMSLYEEWILLLRSMHKSFNAAQNKDVIDRSNKMNIQENDIFRVHNIHKRCVSCDNAKKKPMTEPPENSHLIILPLLALAAFVVLICFRCCHWTAQDVRELSVIKEAKPKKTLAKGLMAVHLGTDNKGQRTTGLSGRKDQLLLLPFFLSGAGLPRRGSQRSQITSSSLSRNSSSVSDNFRERKNGIFPKRPSIRGQKRIVDDIFDGPANSSVKNQRCPSLRRVNSSPSGKKGLDFMAKHKRSASYNRVRFEKRRERTLSASTAVPLTVHAECYSPPAEAEERIISARRPTRLSVDACVGTDSLLDLVENEVRRPLDYNIYIKEKMLERVRSAKIRNRRRMMRESGRQRHSAPDGMFPAKRHPDNELLTVQSKKICHSGATGSESDGLDIGSELSNSVFLSNDGSEGVPFEFTFRHTLTMPSNEALEPSELITSAFSECINPFNTDNSPSRSRHHSACGDSGYQNSSSPRRIASPSLTPPLTESTTNMQCFPTSIFSDIVITIESPPDQNDSYSNLQPNEILDTSETFPTSQLPISNGDLSRETSPMSVSSEVRSGDELLIDAVAQDVESQDYQLSHVSNLSSFSSYETEESKPLLIESSTSDYQESELNSESEPFLKKSYAPTGEPPNVKIKDLVRKRDDFKNNNSRDSSFCQEDETDMDAISTV